MYLKCYTLMQYYLHFVPLVSKHSVVNVSFVIFDKPTLFTPAKTLKDVKATPSGSRNRKIATQIIAVNVEGNEYSDKVLPEESRVTTSFSLDEVIIIIFCLVRKRY